MSGQVGRNTHEKYQSLLDREHQRRLEEAKELMKARRMDELLGVGAALLPIIVAKLCGGMPGQEAVASLARPPAELVDPKDAAIREFFAALSEEELTGMIGSLSSVNQMTLAELHRAFATGPNTVADVAARQLAIRKFLKALTEEEMRGIFASLSPDHRNQLIALYSEYRQMEEAEQERKPEILRS